MALSERIGLFINWQNELAETGLADDHESQPKPGAFPCKRNKYVKP
jgi:hypothetical protein